MASARRYLLIAVVIAHLLFVAFCGVWQGRLLQPAAWPPLSLYGNYTGADGYYGFFAPEVASQICATVIGREASGREHIETHRGRGKEAELRLTTFLLGMAQISVYDTPAAALSVEMFNRIPEVEEVTIQFDQYQVPTMAEYRTGKRPVFREIYRATFRRSSRVAGEHK